MALNGREYLITAGDHEATIVEVGAGLHSYTYRGVDVVCTYPNDHLPPKCHAGGAHALAEPTPWRQLHLRRDRAAATAHRTASTQRHPRAGALGALEAHAANTSQRHSACGTIWCRRPAGRSNCASRCAMQSTPRRGCRVRCQRDQHRNPPRSLRRRLSLVPVDSRAQRWPKRPCSCRRRSASSSTRSRCPVGLQAVAGTPYDLRRGKKLQEAAHGRRVHRARFDRAVAVSRRCTAKTGGAYLVRRDLPLPAGVHPRGTHRAGRRLSRSSR